MRHLKVFPALLALVIFLVTPSEVFSQQRRTQAKPVRKAASTPVAAPTFDTLLGADTYNLYIEVRGVGQLIRSNSVNDVLEPVIKLADPPKEFKALIKWLNTRADDVMTSRLFVAAWPTAKNIPEGLVAIEFSSAEDAAKFEPRLNSFLPKLLPPPAPEEPSDDPSKTTKSEGNTPPRPSYYLQQVGSLILISPTPLKLKDLRPAKNKLMSEDPGFRVARNRFASEQIFAYLDIKGIETESANRRKEREAEEAKQVAEEEKLAANKETVSEAAEDPEKKENENEEQPPENGEVAATVDEVPPDAKPEPDPLAMAADALANSFFRGQSKYPDALGFGIALENDSFDVRALMVTAPGDKCDPIPFFPNLIPGSPIIPESPSILPADTELFVSASLDLPQIYSSMSKQPRPDQGDSNEPEIKTVSATELVGPFAELEKRLKISIKDQVLPMIGSEVVVSIPLKMIDGGPVPKAVVEATPSGTPKSGEQNPASGPSFVLAISLKDKEGMRTLLPKIVESIGFKGASALAQTERQENTELVTYANAFSYAFIENFLVLSSDPAAVKHVVDSYLKHETLSGDTQFKNYTRWQPRQLQGHVYVSPALMDSYKKWANQPSTMMSDPMREILSKLTLVAQPVTYSLSNDGLGTLHEVHIPKNLLLMAVAGLASESNPPPAVQNERVTMSALRVIANAEVEYKNSNGKGSFANMEQLLAGDLVSEELIKGHGYKIQVTLVGDKFEVTAVPEEYGKTGMTSYYIDHTNVLRGADHGGSPATVDDNPVN